MIIKDISVEPLCYGPIRYLIRWECRQCRTEDSFALMACLLADADLACKSCGTMNTYRVPEDKFLPLEAKLEEFRALETELFLAAAFDGDPDLHSLGANLHFPLFSYLSNRVRKAHHG